MSTAVLLTLEEFMARPEVSSPSNRKLYIKAAIYLERGAEQVWIVYPNRRSVTTYTSEGSMEVRADETLDFQGVRIPVTDIFPS